METERDLVLQIDGAKRDIRQADELVRQYLPFIKAQTAKFLHRRPVEGQDEELGIAMFAFHEAVLAYRRSRGAFFSFAATAIRNRLIDYQRKERRYTAVLSLDQTVNEENGSRTFLEQCTVGCDEIAQRQTCSAAREEITEFAAQLTEFGLRLTDVAEHCPKQKRTLDACYRVLACAKERPALLKQLVEHHKLPIEALAAGSGVDRKTIERHRKYLVAILLAYTNGFEIIRGHLRQIDPQRGGRTE